jgi:hypothetical protein
MKLIVIIPAIAMLFSPNLYAKCDKGGKTLFSCLTTKGKQIEVCDSGKAIAYSFGKPNAKPEMAFSVPRAQATTSQWNGVGRYESYAIDIPNKTTTYSVFFGTDRLTDAHTVEAGVNVLIKNNIAATVKCAGKNIINGLEGLNLKPTP